LAVVRTRTTKAMRRRLLQAHCRGPSLFAGFSRHKRDRSLMRRRDSRHWRLPVGEQAAVRDL
jgi:hypothetical protein